jgi:hypothetical protein
MAGGLLCIVLMMALVWGSLYRGWRSEQRALGKLHAFALTAPLGGQNLRRGLGRFGYVLDRVAWLDIPLDAANDEAMTEVAQFGQLKELDLANLKIGDAGLARLAGMRGLESLILMGTQVTDAGMRYLEHMRNLRELNLAYTNVSDEGASTIARLGGLERLSLCHTRIRDAGLKALAPLPNLRQLDISGCGLTNEGLVQLKELRCAFDEPHLQFDRWRRQDASV